MMTPQRSDTGLGPPAAATLRAAALRCPCKRNSLLQAARMSWGLCLGHHASPMTSGVVARITQAARRYPRGTAPPGGAFGPMWRRACRPPLPAGPRCLQAIERQLFVPELLCYGSRAAPAPRVATTAHACRHAARARRRMLQPATAAWVQPGSAPHHMCLCTSVGGACAALLVGAAASAVLPGAVHACWHGHAACPGTLRAAHAVKAC